MLHLKDAQSLFQTFYTNTYERIKAEFIENKVFMVVSFIIGILVYLEEITQGTYYFEDYGFEGGGYYEKTRWLLEFINIWFGDNFAPALYMVFAICIVISSAYFLCKIWGIQKQVHKIIIGSMLLACPFFVTRMDYETKVGYTLVNLFAVLVVYYSQKHTLKYIFLSSILVTFVWAIYPIPINIPITITIFSVLFALLKKGFTSNTVFHEIKNKILPVIISLTLGTGIYYFTLSLYHTFNQEEKSKYKFQIIDSFNAFFQKLHLFWEQFLSVYFREHFMFPFSMKLIFSALVILSLAVLIKKSFTSKNALPIKAAKTCILVLLLYIGLTSYQLTSWFTPNILTDFYRLAEAAFCYAAVLALLFKFGSQTTRQISYILCGVLILGMTIMANNYFHYRLNINRYDEAMTSRILAAIETNPNYSPPVKGKYTVAFWGIAPYAGYPALNFQKKFKPAPYIKGRGGSIYCHFWTEMLPVMRYASKYYTTSGVFDPQIKKRMAPYVQDMPIWPRPGAIKFLNTEKLIIVKLGN